MVLSRSMTRRVLVASVLIAPLAGPAVLAQRDFRSLQTPVKNQGQRSTCTAFALVAALETFPGVPSRLSEQYLYALMKNAQSDFASDPLWQRLSDFAGMPIEGVTVGERLSRYVSIFLRYGVPHEEFLPYQGGALHYDPNSTLPDAIKALLEGRVTADVLNQVGRYGKYGLASGEHVDTLDGDAAKDVTTLMRWMDEGLIAIPVSYVVGPGWHQYTPVGPGGVPNVLTPDDMINVTDGRTTWSYPDAKRVFPNLPADIAAGRLRAVDRLPQAAYGGHAVTIVGYTSNAFIFKNSWGAGWGDAGYGYLSFDYHRLFVMQALRVDRVHYRAPAQREQILSSGLRLTDLRLKAQPREMNGQKVLVLSTYSMATQDPLIDRVTYDVYRNGARFRCDQPFHVTDDIAFRCDLPLGPYVAPSERFDVEVQYSVTVRGAPGVADRLQTATEHYAGVRFTTADYRPTPRPPAGAVPSSRERQR